jgi:hypothetical protein
MHTITHPTAGGDTRTAHPLDLDPDVAHRHGRTLVLAQAHPVAWPDGSLLALHPVTLGDVAAPMLRALQVDGAWLCFDLARVLPTLGDDIRCHPRRDAQGLIWFAFRHRWPTAASCRAALRAHLTPLPRGEGRRREDRSARHVPALPQPSARVAA